MFNRRLNIIVGIALILFGCQSQNVTSVVPIPTKSPVPNYEATQDKFDELFPKPSDNFSKEVVIINDSELGISFQKTDLKGFSWAPDNTRMVGFLIWENDPSLLINFELDNIGDLCADCFDSEIYIWDPVENSYSKISAGNFDTEKWPLVWSPNNQKVYWEDNQYNWLGNSDGANGIIYEFENDKTIDIGDVQLGIFDWHPSGESLISNYFERLNIVSGDVVRMEFYPLVIDEERLSSTPNDHFLKFSVNGEYILTFRKMFDSNNEFISWDLYVYWLQTEVFQNLSEKFGKFNGVYEFSPDGNWMIFIIRDYDTRPTSERIHAYNFYSGCITDPFLFPQNFDTQYKSSLSEDFLEFAWSPDGNKIALAGELRGVGEGVFIVEVSNLLIQDWFNSGTCGD